MSHPNVVEFPTKKRAAVPQGVDACKFERLVDEVQDFLENPDGSPVTESEARQFVLAVYARHQARMKTEGRLCTCNWCVRS